MVRLVTKRHDQTFSLSAPCGGVVCREVYENRNDCLHINEFTVYTILINPPLRFVRIVGGNTKSSVCSRVSNETKRKKKSSVAVESRVLKPNAVKRHRVAL